MDTASYVISVTDGKVGWSMGPDRLSSSVVVLEREYCVRDNHYTATVTVITDYGNTTSQHNFSKYISMFIYNYSN